MSSPFLDNLLRAPSPETERKASVMEMDEKIWGVGLILVQAIIGLVLIAVFREGLNNKLLFAAFSVLSILTSILAARIGNRYVMFAVVVIAAFLTLTLNLPNIDVPSGQPAPQFSIYGTNASLIAVVPSYIYMIWLIMRTNRITRAKIEQERAERAAKREADRASGTGKARQSSTGRKTAPASSRYTPPGTPSKTRQRKLEARRERQFHAPPVEDPHTGPKPKKRRFGLGRNDAQAGQAEADQ